jgi:putative membrane protein
MKKVVGAVAAIAGMALLGGGASQAAAFAPGVSAQDANYTMTSIQGDRFEIKGAKLALENSNNPAVKHVAKIVGRDHAESLADAIDMAHELGIPVPGGPSPSERWELRVIGNDSGEAFDGRYISLELQDHKQDIDEATTEIQWGSSSIVRGSAQEELPTLQKHLDLFKELKRGAS